jgi:short subunit dehydrogenase-like uncharacterized protein
MRPNVGGGNVVFLVYGAYGYTGGLIAREAVKRGLRPILAGRRASHLDRLASELGLPWHAFDLSDRQAVASALSGVGLVLNCAGPFAYTAAPLAGACLRAGRHYVDITGEIGVFQALAARDGDASAAGSMLLPGAGFDVVPTDCLAAHLKRRLPGAERLTLAFNAPGRPSRGTATTGVDGLGGAGMVRRNGTIVPVPAAWRRRIIDLGEGPVRAVTISWGDVATAYHSTGIPNVEVYAAVSPLAEGALVASRYLGWVLTLRLTRSLLRRLVRLAPSGPTTEELALGRSLLWGEAVDGQGTAVVSRLRGPQAYAFTVATALAVVERVLAGDAPPGFQTPSTAYGPDFVLGIPGVERKDED